MENQLSAIMGARLLTVKQIAAGTGLNRVTISRIRNKHAEAITLPTMIKLCDYLNVPLHELVDYDPRDKEAK